MILVTTEHDKEIRRQQILVQVEKVSGHLNNRIQESVNRFTLYLLHFTSITDLRKVTEFVIIEYFRHYQLKEWDICSFEKIIKDMKNISKFISTYFNRHIELDLSVSNYLLWLSL